MKKIVLTGLFFLAASQAFGFSDGQLKRLEGYTLIKVGEITGWQNSDGKRGTRLKDVTMDDGCLLMVGCK